MAEEDSSKSFLMKHWEGYKDFWGDRFSFLDNYSRFIKRDKPLPSWSEADVEEFIFSHPLHGPTQQRRLIKSFLMRHWEGYKEFWGERFSFLENYLRFIKRDKPLPSWSAADLCVCVCAEADVEEFIAFDPVHGPTLKTAREAAKFGAVGGLIGAVSTAGVTWKYSRSLHGTALSFGAGAVFGWTFGQEVANHWLQLYRMDTMASQVKFMEWWQNKVEGQS
ncbi:hypothetical protein RND71_013385 [Anisodus tanguticus]|uniref:Succinate dehydrogenase subunit 6, mitochondrial n=1 Tax=Anisodus tanguticus TaxID=243964 RepID=A0AAE1VGX3_9SOLA|nr:hypothetical protein RND71_013385 [Anisodus tanguticus]